MNPPVPAWNLTVAAGLLAFGAGGLEAQARPTEPAPGRVQGVVFDSTRQAPLSDAAVFLFGTPHQAVSGEDGAFVIADVPAGEYTLLFYHPLLGELGVSPGPRAVTVRANATTEASLATPSWFTVVASQCLMEASEPGTGILAGWVGDGESGMGMPKAHVSLSWSVEGSREPTRRELETDASGWYRLCNAPADVPILASARFLNLQGLRREVAVSEGGMAQVAFLLWELEPARVSGAVHDATSGAGVAGAEVWLQGTSFRRVTGNEGDFRFGDVPPGTYTMFARHLQYGTRRDTLVVASGQALSVDMRVDTEAIELDPLTVTVEAVPLTRRAMGGLTVNREQIEKISSRARDAADVIQALHLPGVIVRRRGDGTLCVGYQPGQVRMMFNSGCVSMEIYINDVHATSAEMALHLPPDAVERIVLFRPVEAGNLFPINTANGVMVIYTRQ
ncbi:MAG TPA: carboxypeptidase regulatory-like domain-containing protein [Longimicrobiales bacterium]|nr:carboxypeptidase regulatory-like domain-containing protein [Longimicrobiales bacterium]